MKIGKALHIVRIIMASVWTLILFELVEVRVTLDRFMLFLLTQETAQVGNPISQDLIKWAYLESVLFHYTILIVIVFLLWRFFAIPKHLGIIKKIKNFKDFYAPYFVNYLEEDDKDKDN